MAEVRASVEVSIRFDGGLLDSRLARVLELVDELGSLRAACRRLGLPYTVAWRSLARLERALGCEVVRSRRGGASGGGGELTEVGRRILGLYEAALKAASRAVEGKPEGYVTPLRVAGSHDPALELLLDLLRGEGCQVDVRWVGSAGGLAYLMTGVADVAGVHLYDPDSGCYNKPYVSRFWLENKAMLVRGYLRELGLAYRRREPCTLRDVLLGKAKMVNRTLGSGTRLLTDIMLDEECRRLGLPREAKLKAKGYGYEVHTHLEAAEAVASRRADVAVVVRYAAESLGLGFKPVRWESFDFAVSADRLTARRVQSFLDTLRSREFREKIEELPGYRAPEDMGRVLYYPGALASH